MAEAVGISEKIVRRIWRQHGLKPHLARTFKVSNDPEFAEKLEAIIGLYLNPELIHWDAKRLAADLAYQEIPRVRPWAEGSSRISFILCSSSAILGPGRLGAI